MKHIRKSRAERSLYAVDKLARSIELLACHVALIGTRTLAIVFLPRYALSAVRLMIPASRGASLAS